MRSRRDNHSAAPSPAHAAATSEAISEAAAKAAILPRFAREFMNLQPEVPPTALNLALLELMPAAVYTCDAEGKITFFNRRAAELWGRRPRLNDAAEKFCACYRVYLHDGTLVPPEATPMAMALRHGTACREVEAVVERPDGARFDASVSIEVLRDEVGRIAGAINVFEDVTAKRVAQRRTQFLGALGDQVAPRRDPGEILETTARLVGEYLRAEQCLANLGVSEGTGEVGLRAWRRAAEGPAADNGARPTAFSAEMWQLTGPAAGTRVSDVVAEPTLRKHLGVYAAWRVRSFMSASGESGGTTIALVVTCPENRSWTNEELEALREAAARVAPWVHQARAETAARMRERDFRSFAEASPMMMWVTDTEGSCTYINSRWREFTGQTEAEAHGEGWLRAVHPDDMPQAGAEFVRALTARVGFQIEYRLRRADGTYRWMIDAGEPRHEAGVFLGYVGSVIDITERKEAEQTLRESEQRHREVAERLSFAMHAALMGDWRWDAATETLRITGRAAELVGIASGEVISREALRAKLHPDDVAPTQEIVQRAMAARQDYEMEYRLRQADGSYVWVAVKGRGVYAADGTLTSVVGIIQEISERKAAEEKVEVQQEQLRFVTSNAPTILSHVDREGRFLFVNKAFADRWQREPEEIIGRTVAEVAGEAAWHAVLPQMQRVLRGETVQIEAEVDYLGLGRRFMKATYAPELGPGGEVRGWLSAATDITERWHAEQALRESEARLRLAAKSGKLGLWDWDIVSGHVTWSDSLFDILGVNPAGFGATVDAFVELMHPDDREPVRRAMRHSVEDDAAFEVEFRAVKPDGAVVWLFTNAIVLREEGRALRMLGTTFDITERKRAELALRESEQRFRTLASHAPVGIFLSDPKGETIFVNECWCEMAGLKSEDAMGSRWAAAIHVEDRPRVAMEWSRAIAENRASAAEFRFCRADGKVTWVQGKAVQLRDEAGRLAGYIGTVADLTERRAAEEQLRTREAQLRVITTNIPISIAQCSRDLRFNFVNPAYAGRFGLRPSQVVGRGLEEILGDGMVQKLRPYIDRVLRGETVHFETEVNLPTGGRRFLQVSYVPDTLPDGRVRGWLAAMSDLTDRREMEEALRESEARFRQLADSMPQIVFAADAKGHFDYYNRRWYELTEATAGLTGDDSFLPVLHPEDRHRFLRAWYGSVESGEPFQIEYRLRFRSGAEYRWHLGRALPVRNEREEIVRWFGTCTDIHDWKLVQEQLRAAQGRLETHAAELEQRVAERTASLRDAITQMEEFSYSVSHDLRAPLRAMNAYALALVEDYGDKLDAGARDYLERIQRSSVRMEKLTHDVLTYSRVARGEVALARLDVGHLLRDVIVQYRELQPPAATIEIAGSLAPVRAHESSLGQCFANLLTNAAKFVGPGVKPVIRIWTEPVGDHVRVWIQDNGIGIAPQYQARLFRIFERVPTRQAYDGTGIGLAMVRKAAEKMGGTCGVESDGVHGSRFWIDLLKA